jgi:hypothetical protein
LFSNKPLVSSVYFFNHWFPEAHPGIYEPIWHLKQSVDCFTP